MALRIQSGRRVEFPKPTWRGSSITRIFFATWKQPKLSFSARSFFAVTRQVEPPVGWPRVHAECDYAQPLRFEDEVEIHLL